MTPRDDQGDHIPTRDVTDPWDLTDADTVRHHPHGTFTAAATANAARVRAEVEWDQTTESWREL